MDAHISEKMVMAQILVNYVDQTCQGGALMNKSVFIGCLKGKKHPRARSYGNTNADGHQYCSARESLRNNFARIALKLAGSFENRWKRGINEHRSCVIAKKKEERKFFKKKESDLYWQMDERKNTSSPEELRSNRTTQNSRSVNKTFQFPISRQLKFEAMTEF